LFQPIDLRPIDAPFDVTGLRRAVGDLDTAAAIFVADARLADAPIVFVNRPFTRTTGLLRDDVLGRSWTLLSTSMPAPDGRAASIAPGRPISVDLPNLGSDDGAPTTCFTIHALHDSADRIAAYVGIAAASVRRDA
jgi:PAS domain-containing protein